MSDDAHGPLPVEVKIETAGDRDGPSLQTGPTDRNKTEQRARARTPAQLERQRKAYDRSVMDRRTYREIAEELGVNVKTIVTDIRAEKKRRVDELGKVGLDEARADAIATYELVISMGFQRAKVANLILGQIAQGKSDAKVSDRSLSEIVAARERIDKILGIDAPLQIDAGLDALIEAFAPKD